MLSVRAQKISQEALQNVILPALKKAKDEQKTTIDFAKLVTSLGYEAEFSDLNFSIAKGIPNVTIESGAPAHGSTVIFYGTSLLTGIDYSNCQFKNCNFDYCNLSNSQFKLTSFDQCTMNRTAIHNSSLEKATFTECIMDRASFDASELRAVEYTDSKLTNATMTHLKECSDVRILDCNVKGINFLGSVQAVNSSIAYRQQTIIEDVYLSETHFVLHNARVGKNKPGIAMTWDGRKQGFTAELARTALIEKDMQPLLVDYFPPMDEKELKELEQEVIAAGKKIETETKSEKSISFQILEAALADAKAFPTIVKLYHYSENILTQVDGLLIPGGVDINPLMYGQEKDDQTKPSMINGHYDFRRDIIEFSLVHHQQQIGTPIYAICRGSQICALSYGGELYQHISAKRAFIYEKVKLADSPALKSKASHARTLQPVKIEDTKSNKETDEKKTVDGDHVLYVHHQGYTLESAADRAFFEIVATTTFDNENEKKFDLTVTAESLPRNIFIVQFHPEGGKDERIIQNFRISSKLGSSFLEGFYSRVVDFMAERDNEVYLRLHTKNDKYYMHLQHVHSVTTPSHVEENVTRHYDTVVMGMGPTGLLAGLLALKREEKVAFIIDHSLSKSSNNKEIEIDKEVFEFFKKYLDPKLISEYVKHGQIVEEQNYIKFAPGIFEEILLKEIQKYSADMIEVRKIDKDLLKRLNDVRHKESITDSKAPVMKVDKQFLRDVTSLRHQQDVDLSNQTLTLSEVKSINKTRVDSLQKLSFNHLMVCNGGKRKLEKGIIHLGGDNPHTIHPIAPYRATVRFELKNTTFADCEAKILGVKTGELKSNPVPLQELKERQWEHASRPHSQIYKSSDEKAEAEQFCIECEIPETLFKKANSADSSERDAARKQIREFARALLQDQLPHEMMSKIIDPEYTDVDPEQSSRKKHAESTFKFEHFALDHTFMVRPHATHEKPPADIAFFGEDQVLLGVKLVKHYHEAQINLQTGLEAIKRSSAEEKKGHTTEEKLCSEIFTEYHIKARREIDMVRDSQYSWIENRNTQEIKAMLFLDIQNNIYHIADILESILQKLTPKSSSSLISGLFQSQKAPDLVLLNILQDNLYTYVRDSEKIISYETLLEEICFEAKLNPEEYYANISTLCENIYKAMLKLPVSSIKDEVNQLGYALFNLQHLCNSELDSIKQKKENILKKSDV